MVGNPALDEDVIVVWEMSYVLVHVTAKPVLFSDEDHEMWLKCLKML